MLHGLVSRSVFSVAHRIVSEDENRGQFHQGRKPDRRTGVIAEDKEGRAVGPDFRDGQPVEDGAHGVLPDAEVEIFSSRIIRLKVTGAFVCEESLVRWSEISRSAHKPGDILRQDVQRLAGGLAPGNTLLVRGKDRQIAIPTSRKFSALHLLDFGSERRILGPIGVEELYPFPARTVAARSDSVLEVLINFGRREELRIFGPSVGALGKLYLVVAQRFAVSFSGVLLMRRAVPDVTIQNDKGGAACLLFEYIQSVLDTLDVVGVANSQNIPAIGQEPCCHVLCEGDLSVPFDRDPVVVIDPTEVVEPQMASQ